MQLSLRTDYSLRVLLFLAVQRDELATIPQIAEAYGISRAHLMKVVQELAELGYVHTVRGRGGGLRLAADPACVRLGDVVRRTEELHLVECFSAKTQRCRVESACRLKGAFQDALDAFLRTLNEYTLAEIVEGRAAPLQRLLQLP